MLPVCTRPTSPRPRCLPRPPPHHRLRCDVFGDRAEPVIWYIYFGRVVVIVSRAEFSPPGARDGLHSARRCPILRRHDPRFRPTTHAIHLGSRPFGACYINGWYHKRHTPYTHGADPDTRKHTSRRRHATSSVTCSGMMQPPRLFHAAAVIDAPPVGRSTPGKRLCLLPGSDVPVRASPLSCGGHSPTVCVSCCGRCRSSRQPGDARAMVKECEGRSSGAMRATRPCCFLRVELSWERRPRQPGCCDTAWTGEHVVVGRSVGNASCSPS